MTKDSMVKKVTINQTYDMDGNLVEEEVIDPQEMIQNMPTFEVLNEMFREGDKVMKFLDCLINTMTEVLRLSTDKSNTAVELRDADDSLIIAGVVKYHDGENGNPGNFSYTFTTDEDDLKDVSTIIDLSSNKIVSVGMSIVNNTLGLIFDTENKLVEWFREGMKAVIKNLNSVKNSRIKTDVVEIEGEVTEDGLEIAITPTGMTKQALKDDSGIEK